MFVLHLNDDYGRVAMKMDAVFKGFLIVLAVCVVIFITCWLLPHDGMEASKPDFTTMCMVVAGITGSFCLLFIVYSLGMEESLVYADDLEGEQCIE